MELIDIGVNLAHDSFDADRDAILERATQAGVAQMVVTGSSEGAHAGRSSCLPRIGTSCSPRRACIRITRRMSLPKPCPP
jgi:hypothetical protein